MNVTFTLYGEVTDIDALYEAAKARAIEDGMSEKDAMESLTEENPDAESDGEVPRFTDASACLRMLLDPGSIPGFEIHDSCAE